MTKQVIFLSGYVGSGKDFCSDILGEFGYRRYAFADALKQFVCEKYGLPFELCYTQEGKKTEVNVGVGITKTVRQILIDEGATLRKQKDTIFVDIVGQMILNECHSLIVISDWRYPIERIHLATILLPEDGWKFITARINRDGIIVSDDLSEHQLDSYPFDIEIPNNGTKDELRAILIDKLGIRNT